MSAALSARHEDGLYRVPGAELLWVEIDGRSVGVHSCPAYFHTDGSLEPGRLESWVRTEIRFTHFPDEGLRIRPLICDACGDTGVSPDYNTDGSDTCLHCMGLGNEKNLRTCVVCGGIQYFPAPPLPAAPGQAESHELLLERAHAGCLVGHE